MDNSDLKTAQQAIASDWIEAYKLFVSPKSLNRKRKKTSQSQRENDAMVY